MNDSIVTQYRMWLGDFIRGDWGESSRTRQPVSEVIPQAFGNTIQLIVWGVLISALVAIGIGVYSALKQYSAGDYVFTGLTYVGIAMPPFWFALIAIHFLAVAPQDWFDLSSPPVKFVGLHSVGSVGVQLGLRAAPHPAGAHARACRSWRAGAASSGRRCSTCCRPTTSARRGPRASPVAGDRAPCDAQLADPPGHRHRRGRGLLFGGLIITETIFSIPGMGRLFFQSLLQGDVVVLEAWMLVVAVFILLFNLLADLTYGFLDPRIRVQ